MLWRLFKNAPLRQQLTIAAVSLPAFGVGWYMTEAVVEPDESIFSRANSVGMFRNMNLYPVSNRSQPDQTPTPNTIRATDSQRTHHHAFTATPQTLAPALPSLAAPLDASHELHAVPTTTADGGRSAIGHLAAVGDAMKTGRGLAMEGERMEVVGAGKERGRIVVVVVRR
ncbi:hypothetical protein HDU96_000549 [Phlyctochytrium bullatum]|nr:hypothetical protein HDU96_000549 [Phlyctochytrium bullatum]